MRRRGIFLQTRVANDVWSKACTHLFRQWMFGKWSDWSWHLCMRVLEALRVCTNVTTLLESVCSWGSERAKWSLSESVCACVSERVKCWRIFLGNLFKKETWTHGGICAVGWHGRSQEAEAAVAHRHMWHLLVSGKCSVSEAGILSVRVELRSWYSMQDSEASTLQVKQLTENFPGRILTGVDDFASQSPDNSLEVKQ